MSDLRERCNELSEYILELCCYYEEGHKVKNLVASSLEAFANGEGGRAIQDFIHGRDKLCLNCGAKEPCDLKDDPQSPCTFDPTPMELLKALRKKNLAERIKGMETVRDEFIRRKRHIRKSMMDIMFLKWIDAEIAKLKEEGEMHQTRTEDHIAKRRIRNCDWCWEHIKIGDAYRRYRFYDGGTASTVYMHPECHKAMGEMARQEGGWCEWTPGMERPEKEAR